MCIRDHGTGYKFLIDTGSVLSIVPSTEKDRIRGESLIPIQSVNGTRIKTYGEKVLDVSLGLNRTFKWNFLVADVRYPIIGADFLSNFNILVDVREKNLIDVQSNTKVRANCDLAPCISLIVDVESDYEKLLVEFNELVTPYNFSNDKNLPEFYEHNIITNGPPVGCRPRRLSPKLLTETKKSICKLLNEGRIRPSSSPYGSPINLVKKTDGTYRVTGDYRKLNSITQFDLYPLLYLSDFTSMLSGKIIFSKIDLEDVFSKFLWRKVLFLKLLSLRRSGVMNLYACLRV